MAMFRAHALAAAAGLALSASALAQPASTNLGTLTLGTPVPINVPALGNGEIAWYKFTLSQPVSLASLRFLDITTVAGTGTGGSADSEIGLFSSTGNLIASDDDDGLSTAPFLTFGTGSGILPVGTTPTVGNGRDGDLPAGVYYLAVAYSGITWQATGFGTSFSNTLPLYAHTVTISAANLTGVTPPPSIDLGTLDYGGAINRSGDTLSANQVKWYKVVLPGANNTAQTWVDIDTEGTTLSPLNRTQIALYSPSGAIMGNSFFSTLTDATDGSGSLSQLTFGLSNPPRNVVGDGLAYNGRDGTIRPGPYYLAFSSTPVSTPSNSNAVGTNFGWINNGANAGQIVLNLSAGALVTNPGGAFTINPTFGNLGQVLTASLTVTPGANPASTGITATLDTAGIGAGVVNLLDNGVAPDAFAGDGIYSASITIPNNATSGTTSLTWTVADAQSRSATGTANFTVVGNLPGCPAGEESHSLTDMVSDGVLNNAANGVTTFTATTTANITTVRISGRFLCTNAFGNNARIRVTAPDGVNNFDIIPFTVSGPSGVPVDVALAEVALPCGNIAGAGQWTVRTYETVDDAGIDGTWSNLCVALVTGAGATDQWSDDQCGTDAGDLPASAQVPTGSGALNKINGTIGNTTDVDMFLISVCDPVNFTATTVNGTGSDTQLWLFDSAGIGLINNDDDPPGTTLQSTLTNSANVITAAGNYYLAISPYNRDAVDVGLNLLFLNTPFRQQHSPADGPGALNPVDSWSGTSTPTTPFNYTITLTGACIPGPGSGGACNKADITEIGGSVEAPGNPDGQLTVDDIILFINLFSDGTGCPGTPGVACNRADITEIGGSIEAPGVPDGQLTVDDLIVFFNSFSNGC